MKENKIKKNGIGNIYIFYFKTRRRKKYRSLFMIEKLTEMDHHDDEENLIYIYIYKQKSKTRLIFFLKKKKAHEIIFLRRNFKLISP